MGVLWFDAKCEKLRWKSILQKFTVTQIKQIRVVIDDMMKKNDEEVTMHESTRNDALREIGNHLHSSCIVSNDEVSVLNFQRSIAVVKKINQFLFWLLCFAALLTHFCRPICLML